MTQSQARSGNQVQVLRESRTTPPSDGAGKVWPSVQIALLELLARHAKRLPIPIFLTTGLMGYMAYEAMGGAMVAGWLGIVAAVMTGRLVIMNELLKRTHVPGERRLTIAALLSFLNGLAHSVPVYFFVELTDFQRSVITISLMGFAAGSVGTTAGYRRVYLAYLAPTLLPLMVFWGIQPGGGMSPLHTVIALLLLLFGVIVLSLARDTFRQFYESFEIRLEQVELNRQLSESLRQSELASAAKTRFLAAASHDLRQPVHSLKLFTAALGGMANLAPEARAIIDHMKLALTTFDGQLDALLDISKLEAGVVETHPETFDLTKLMHRVASQFLPQAEEKGLRLEVLAPATAYAHTDPHHLERIVNNLVINAVKYTRSGGVSITVEPSADAFEVSVADSGPGIAPSEQERVFEDFYQLDNPARDRTKGLGIGLGNARRYAGLLGVPLQLVSDGQSGTTFKLKIPRSEQRPVHEKAVETPLAIEGLVVLAVDDDPEVLSGLKAFLESRGSLVDTCLTTTQAVELAERRRPDLLICDFRLAGDDSGLCSVKGVRTLYHDLPAVMITGDTAPDRLLEASQADVELLHKPVGEDALLRAMGRALQRSRRVQ
jgi:signal transduction histidine kinase/CheY-like chemotaxis protein